MSAHPYRPDHHDPRVTERRNQIAAFRSQLDTRPRTYEAPLPGDCYCGDPIQDHNRANDACDICGGCEGYVEHTEVTATRDALDIDDQLNESRRRDNTTAAINLTMHRHGRAR